tara:strand:+ start:3092 stop:4321 length:1230 start_codon:yes stop_codon:yes gene_type:complete
MSCCRVFRINRDVQKEKIVAVGRFQPPHCGHYTIFNEMLDMIDDPNNIANEGYIFVMGFASNARGLKRNPLGPNEKLKYLNKMLNDNKIKFIIGHSIGEMLSSDTKELLGDRLIIMPLPDDAELSERKADGDNYAYPKVANFHRLHYYFKNIGEENNYVMVAGEDRVTQVKRDNKSRKLQLPIREAGQKRSSAAQSGDICTLDDSPSGSRIRHLALKIDSFSLRDPTVKKILKFTKLGNMTDEDVLSMVNDIRKVNGKPEIYNVTEDEIILGGRRKTRRRRRKSKRSRRKRRKTKKKRKRKRKTRKRKQKGRGVNVCAWMKDEEGLVQARKYALSQSRKLKRRFPIDPTREDLNKIANLEANLYCQKYAPDGPNDKYKCNNQFGVCVEMNEMEHNFMNQIMKNNGYILQ